MTTGNPDIDRSTQGAPPFEAAEAHRQVYETSPHGIVFQDASGAILTANPAAERILGLSLAQLQGRTSMDPGWRAIDEEGQPFPGTTHPAMTALGTGLPAHGVVMGVFNPAFQGTRWVEISAIPLFRQGSPKPYQVLVTFADITERRAAEEERKRLQAQLLQSQKMESLGVLAGGVAHDMNNVLGAILALASMSLRGLSREDPSRQAFELIEGAALRGGTMVRSLLNFARQSPLEESAVDLNAILREEVHLLEHTTLARIRLHLDLAPALPPVRGDAGALSHAFMNLAVNALDALPENGTLTLRTRDLGQGEVAVVVEDDGCGMPREVLERAMEPFFTTKEVGKGTGLGLSMVYSTVKAHGGRMQLRSEPGKGTRIDVVFPVWAPPNPQEDGGLPEAPPAQARPLRVCLVDDDDLVLKSAAMLLEMLGHEVHASRSGEEFLAALETGCQPDLVVLDMNMPGMGGIRTLESFREMRPAVPVLFATGRADEAARRVVRNHPAVHLLPKPYTLSDLQERLAQVALPGA